MPYPRRVIIYLREKNISPSLITIVPVSDPQMGNVAPPDYPPRPSGSLPILAIPKSDSSSQALEDFIYIRQSLAIMNYLEDLCESGTNGFPKSSNQMRGGMEILDRARHQELMSLADECLVSWNPVRLFGSGLGSEAIPAAAKESLRWIHRNLAAIEEHFSRNSRDFSHLIPAQNAHATLAEIVLYSFLEFVEEIYGLDLTQGSGEVVSDVYGRETKQVYPKLKDFYRSFKARDSAKLKVASGDVATDAIKAGGRSWHEG
ncbi:MAG: hypothetical protein LQ351_002427, partial [Letrouitia transgressa]